MAYAIYYLLDTNSVDAQNIQNDLRYKKSLYKGLVAFYAAFYGNFADNEEAICLLCKYYPKDEDSWLEREEVSVSLQSGAGLR